MRMCVKKMLKVMVHGRDNQSRLHRSGRLKSETEMGQRGRCCHGSAIFHVQVINFLFHEFQEVPQHIKHFH